MKKYMSTFAKYVSFALLLLCFTALGVLTACQSGKGEETTSAETIIPEPPTDTTADTQPPETETQEEATEPAPQLYTYPAEQAGAKTSVVLKAEDFGVVGDGVTDDGPAISAAVNAAIEQQATLLFDGSKTYYMKETDNVAAVFRSPFAMVGASGITIDGQGATFLSAPGVNYFAMAECADVVLKNMNFDYAVPVYLVGRVVSNTNGTVVFETNEEPYAANYNFTHVNGFSIRYNEGIQNRPHAFMGSCIRTGEKQVTVTYPNNPGYAAGDLVFLPNPGIGHAFSEVVYLGGNTGAMVYENIQILSAPRFIMAIKGNNAEMYFTNVDMMPAENDPREIKMVSWRDGYHCKDNRLPLHWQDCDAGVMFDDVFNVSGTLGYVLTAEKGSVFTVTNYEFYSSGQRVGFDCRAGDVLDVYDIQSAAYCGTATVRQARQNADGTTTIVLEYGEMLEGVKEGFVVGNRMTGAPGSTIENCKFEGTFRFLRDIRITNTTFDLLVMWIMVEGSVEGPLPGDIDFVNCTFNGGTMEIDAYNRNTGKTLRKIANQIENINAHGCTFNDQFKVSSRCKRELNIFDTVDEANFTSHIGVQKIVVSVITPVESDFKNAVIYDWDRHTMNLTGGEVIPVSALDETVKSILKEDREFSTAVLHIPAGATVTLDGLSKDSLPFFYEEGKMFIITFDYYGDGVTAELSVTGGKTLGELTADGKVAGFNVIYETDGKGTGISLQNKSDVPLYIGNISISSATNQNPSEDQMSVGHTFIWTDVVTVGKRNDVLTFADIKDADVKAAIEGAEEGFTTGRVLHLNGQPGEFTGMTDKGYFTAGRTYHLTLYAYVKEPVPAGTTVYLLALDNTQGNRVLAQGLFDKAGVFRLDMDWTVGNTGEYALTFYSSSNNFRGMNIYLGDFTISVPVPMNPSGFVSRDDYKLITAAEALSGHTFDFTEGNLLRTGHDAYTTVDQVPAKAADAMKAAGFGDTVYFAEENFDMEVSGIMTNGKSYVVTMEVYDCIGNLATSGTRGAFVLLKMTNGVQNSAEVSYIATVDSENSRHLTLTFNVPAPGLGTDTFLFYELAPCEYYIGSVTVKGK